jgi:2-dehydropantoate 2-reductase
VCDALPMGSIAILGAGGVGGFLAAALARAGQDVTVVAREPTAALIVANGIEVQSRRLGSFVARPEAVPILSRRVEALIVATKAVGLESALARIEAPPALAVPLLNGLDHMDVLRKHFGPGRVAAGTIRIESDRPEPGRIAQTSPFLRVEVATDRPELRPAVERLVTALQDAEIPAGISPSEPQILWSKLVRLNALALTTSAADQPLGFIRSDPEWRATLQRCLEEAAAVARADGADVDPAAQLAVLDEDHPELGSSMQRDIAAGREPELDAIAGSVLRAAARHGVDCPTVAHLTVEVARRAGVTPPAAATAAA